MTISPSGRLRDEPISLGPPSPTPRQTEVHQLLRQGLTNREIRELLYIEEATVKMTFSTSSTGSAFGPEDHRDAGRARTVGSGDVGDR